MATVTEDLTRTRADRVPPHNMEAEESVLGSMMLSGEAIASVVETLKAEDFYRPAHRRIFESILGIYARGEPVDAITVVEELKRRHEIEDVGGALSVYHLVVCAFVHCHGFHSLNSNAVRQCSSSWLEWACSRLLLHTCICHHLRIASLAGSGTPKSDSLVHSR